jgi:hypothetical protein
MSASKLDRSGFFRPVVVRTQQTRLTLQPQELCVRKNGIEFRAGAPIEPWTEMTVELESPGDAKRIHCNGVVVDCVGNRHAGYRISMIFTGVSPHDQTRLNALAVARPL